MGSFTVGVSGFFFSCHVKTAPDCLSEAAENAAAQRGRRGKEVMEDFRKLHGTLEAFVIWVATLLFPLSYPCVPLLLLFVPGFIS